MLCAFVVSIFKTRYFLYLILYFFFVLPFYGKHKQINGLDDHVKSENSR